MKKNMYIFTILTFVFLATPAFALTTTPLWIHDSTGNLGTYNIASDTVNVIGDMGVVMTDIAFSPSGDLYGISFTNLYTINTSNASVTNIGSHGVAGGNALVFGSDGTLYAAGTSTTNLYSLNPTNGTPTLLGDMGFSSSGDLAFHNGAFYLSANTSPSDTLVLLSLSTFAGSAIGNFGFDNVYGLATADDALLYGLSGFDVFSVDVSTGSGTLIGNYSGGGLGVSYGSSFITEAAPVPEPSTFALLGAGLAGLLAWSRKRS